MSFPKHRSSTLERDLLILGPGAGPCIRNSPCIVVSMNDGRSVGCWDDKVERITTFVSGSLTNVPEPLRLGTGVAAAQALAALYAEYSTQAFAPIDGAFCCAILDWQRGAIVVARDKLGIGRAYVSRDGEAVTFSDSLSHLLDAGRKSVELDVDSIYAFLMIGWIPTPHSMCRNVEKLPPGTFVESCDGTLTQTTYYDVPHAASLVSHRPEEHCVREAETLGRHYGLSIYNPFLDAEFVDFA